jgi:hypothetical protein
MELDEGEPPPAKKVKMSSKCVIYLSCTDSSLHLQKRENPKQIWLLTYGAGCCSVTHTILSACGLVVDECHTVTWRESKYTLIHLNKDNRIRRNPLLQIMEELNTTHGIKGTEIFGFDTMSCNSQVQEESILDHPGFKYMIQSMNTNISRLDSWTRDGDIVSNRKGVLWKYLEDTNPERMTRAQLITRVKEWGPAAKEYEELKQSHSILLATHSETEIALQNMCVCYETERDMTKEVMERLKTKIRENVELEKELIQLRIMPTI